MPRTSTLDPALKAWLNQTVYPNLTHDRVFGGLPNYTKAEYSETRYGDCPHCQKPKAFYMLPDRPVGTCGRCNRRITWWAFLHFAHTEAETIATIARLAGVDPLEPATEEPDLFRA